MDHRWNVHSEGDTYSYVHQLSNKIGINENWVQKQIYSKSQEFSMSKPKKDLFYLSYDRCWNYQLHCRRCGITKNHATSYIWISKKKKELRKNKQAAKYSDAPTWINTHQHRYTFQKKKLQSSDWCMQSLNIAPKEQNHLGWHLTALDRPAAFADWHHQCCLLMLKKAWNHTFTRNRRGHHWFQHTLIEHVAHRVFPHPEDMT